MHTRCCVLCAQTTRRCSSGAWTCSTSACSARRASSPRCAPKWPRSRTRPPTRSRRSRPPPSLHAPSARPPQPTATGPRCAPSTRLDSTLLYDSCLPALLLCLLLTLLSCRVEYHSSSSYSVRLFEGTRSPCHRRYCPLLWCVVRLCATCTSYCSCWRESGGLGFSPAQLQARARQRKLAGGRGQRQGLVARALSTCNVPADACAVSVARGLIASVSFR